MWPVASKPVDVPSNYHPALLEVDRPTLQYNTANWTRRVGNAMDVAGSKPRRAATAFE